MEATDAVEKDVLHPGNKAGSGITVNREAQPGSTPLLQGDE